MVFTITQKNAEKQRAVFYFLSGFLVIKMPALAATRTMGANRTNSQ